jgi:hypothetical protein
MNLIIVTPFSRTIENIQAMYASVMMAAATIETEWIIVYQHNVEQKLMEWQRTMKSNRGLQVTIVRGNTATSYYGNSYRNQAVGQITEAEKAWVYFLDDDNILHPDFPKLINVVRPEDEVVFFTQVWKSGEIRLEPDHLGVGGVDTAMMLVRSYIIKKHLWNEEEYTADGLMAETLASNHNSKRIHEPYCFYNYLR